MWRRRERLISLGEALAALGSSGYQDEEFREVALDSIVGTVARGSDFDGAFRPRHGALRARSRALAAAVERGVVPPPVDLVVLGELYFVADGHHRIAVAKARGWAEIPARVRRICTVAYGMSCLRLEHLASKAAERGFLERVPLPDDVRFELWLDEPAQWRRLAEAAEAWGYRQALDGRLITDRRRLAETWWAEEVIPTAGTVCSGQPVIERYVRALALDEGRSLG